VEQLDAGLSQRALALQWINPRTGGPYSQMPVSYTRQVFEKLAFQIPRPRFRDAYNEITHAKPAKGPVHAEPFHWINADLDLRAVVAKLVASWPTEARGLAPKLLHELADILEEESECSSRDWDTRH